MRTAGIDLSTEAAKTAVCVIDWHPGRAVVSFLQDTTDEGLVQVCSTADRVGIDSPFGWPMPFVEAIAAHSGGAPWPGRDHGDVAAYRRMLAFRATDEFVYRQAGKLPLSVSTDRIGRTAMRCALILARLDEVDRAGERGCVAEVYPAASLARWGLRSGGYKGAANRDRLQQLFIELTGRLPWLELDVDATARCMTSDDAFDALVAALTARAIHLGLSLPPEDEGQRRLAQAEGWIHLPHPGSLGTLLGSPDGG